MVASACIYMSPGHTIELARREGESKLIKMAEAVMGPLVGRLQELAMSKARAMVAVNNDVRSLRDKLMWMQAFLHEAEPWRRAKNDELIRVCMQQTRDAVFDAEDAVDEYFLQVDLSRYPSWSHAMVKFLSGFTTQVRVRHDLSKRIISINTRLESIIENKGKYKIDDTSDNKSITTWRPSTAISATAKKLDDFLPCLVGRNDQLDELENWITTRSTKSTMVITVSGKSGVGKTRLVEEIYEKPSTKRHFHVQAWATCAPNLSATNIMKLILLRLKKGHVATPKDEVENKLKKKLESKKYLLVIDGEVSSTEWNRILNTLPKDNSESRVVRITQEKITEAPIAGFVPEKTELRHLENKGTTAELFYKTLLMDNKDGDLDEKAVKEEYAQPIFNATGGLPLAVVLLPGLLRTKEYPGEWENVFDHLKGKSSEWKRLHIILSMCLDDLPHDLKSCFLYFAGFPVSTLVRARTLVCMWMAEGFLRPKEGKTMEKMGECYLQELIHRRLVTLPPLENAAPGDERVTVQTRVHDFLVLEAQEANFVEIHSGDDVPTLSTARRLSLQNHRDKYAALTEPLPKLRSVLSSFENENSPGAAEISEETRNNVGACRPFLCKTDSNKDHMRKLLQVSRFLRVISLDGLQIGNTLPSEIGNVVHLQFLGITSCSLDEIPSSVGNLTRLQTLDVRGTSVLRLPREFWRIRMLRHVFGSIVLPRRVGKLEQLQTLEAVNPDDGGGSWDITTFASMKRLQSLYIYLSRKNMHALAAIYKLKYLVFLSIRGDEIPCYLLTGSKLPRLEEMVLKGKITRPPNGSSHFYPPTLTKLSLKKTKVAQYFINGLSHELPLLATLSLFHESYAEACLVFYDGFQSLKELTLDVEDLEEIEIQEPVFPHLLKLKIFTHSSSVRLRIFNRPDIEEIIRVEDKFLYDNNMGTFNTVVLS